MLKRMIIIISLLMTNICWSQMNATIEPPSITDLMSLSKIKGPIDFCGEPVPLHDPDIQESLEKELILTIWNRAQVVLWIKRTGRYMPYIEKMLKNNGLPDDLKYVAVVESSLLPNIGSSKNAVGYWQFISATGERYGLTVDKEIDQRRNLEKSTTAAIAYFKKLYADFGSWTLAAAAYNMGEFGLQAAISAQKTTNYYYLYLPMETQRYLYKILTVKIIMTNPEKFGFTYTSEDLYRPKEVDRIQLDCSEKTPIQLIADAAGTYYKTIRDLNPEFRTDYLPPGSYSISIPKGTSKNFYSQYQKLYQQWQAENAKEKFQREIAKTDSKNIYVVKKGDSLGLIAERFNVNVSDIIQWNKLDPKKSIHPGQRLTIYSSEM